MPTVSNYRVMMKVELDGPPKEDPEFEKIVEAASEDEALAKARNLLKVENSEVNHLKVYFWAIQRSR